ncbi:MAG: alanine racemase [Sporomusaceae bacterium]|jgi:alanine racemase|nr:alanine racemase [Sporomusaceae bacterium]
MWQRGVWAEINLSAIKNNIRAVKKLLQPKTKICAVVKADAYGHGAVPVANAALSAGADMLAVAFLQEALNLRAGGITSPILILGFTPAQQAPLAVAAGITQTVYTKEALLAVSAAAVAAKTTAKIHIKIDTGMGRIGLLPKDAAAFIGAAAELPGISVEGVFSHFADADSLDKTYAKAQLASFQQVLRQLEGMTIELKHIANSAAALQMREAHLDMARLGIAMYGLWPSPEMETAWANEVKLTPAMTLCAQISHLKDLLPGESISYGRTYFTTAKQKIATLPLGYADGLNRNLSGKMSVFLKGRAAPLAGRICMDQCMADVSGIEGVAAGDTAVIFGAGALSASDIAALLNTINYEVVCSIGKRVPRLYY